MALRHGKSSALFSWIHRVHERLLDLITINSELTEKGEHIACLILFLRRR